MSEARLEPPGRADSDREARADAAARDPLAELRASISRLMRGLNHDLKNPLGAADGYLDLMLQGFRGELEPDQRETVERVRALIASGVAILEDVVTFARASLGELDVRRSDSDMNTIAHMAVDEHSERAERQSVDLVFEAAATDVRTLTDSSLVGQILRQLIANALDHTPDGGRVEVRVARSGDGITLAVSDTGAGIPADACERIFLEFERGAPPVHERETAGIGFGLPLARALADQLDGRLALDTEVGRGSTFTLTLPARSSD